MKGKYLTILTFVVASLIIFALSWQNKIIFTDELLFEEASYQMLKTGDLLTPHLGEKVWLEKPPLYFWFTTTIFKITGISPFTRRVGTLITAIGTIIITYKLSRLFYKKRNALWTVILLTITPLFLYFTKTASLDIPTAFFITATLYAYERGKHERNWLHLSGVFLGLGILTRSFLSLTPIMIITIDQCMNKKERIKKRILITSLMIAAIMAVPWNALMLLRHPSEYLQNHLSFNITKHLFEQTPGHQPVTLGNFLINIFLRFNPLSFLAALPLLFKKKVEKPESLFLIWIAVTLIPLSISATRHEWYAIQALPPIAILSAGGLVQLIDILKSRLKPQAIDISYIFGLSFLLAIPVGVFSGISKEATVITMLNNFLESTTRDTPLNNLEYQFVPNTTLFNPREGKVLKQEELKEIKEQTYLYIDNNKQYEQAKDNLEGCCTHEVFLELEDKKIVNIKPKNE